MTTPTREQFEAAMAPAFGHADAFMRCPDSAESYTYLTTRLAWVAWQAAYAAARAQALDEAAAKVRAILKQCEDDDVNDPPLEFTATQIEALKGKQ